MNALARTMPVVHPLPAQHHSIRAVADAASPDGGFAYLHIAAERQTFVVELTVEELETLAAAALEAAEAIRRHASGSNIVSLFR